MTWALRAYVILAACPDCAIRDRSNASYSTLLDASPARANVSFDYGQRDASVYAARWRTSGPTDPLRFRARPGGPLCVVEGRRKDSAHTWQVQCSRYCHVLGFSLTWRSTTPRDGGATLSLEVLSSMVRGACSVQETHEYPTLELTR